MVNDRVKPIASASRLKIRTHIAWNVDTHISFASGPTRADTRSFISLAALLVKVIAKIFQGFTSFSLKIYAMRWVKTRVFPLPAPAIINSGPSVCSTASFCRSLSPFVN